MFQLAPETLKAIDRAGSKLDAYLDTAELKVLETDVCLSAPLLPSMTCADGHGSAV
jgi:hypothetical protein